MTILIISDTHGLIRDELRSLLPKYDLVMHAGDIGGDEVLDELKKYNSNVVAVRGNIDKAMNQGAPVDYQVQVSGLWFYIIHDLNELKLDPSGQFDFMVSGHTHKAKVYAKDGVKYINPGSIGPKRFNLPVTYVELEIDNQYDHKIKVVEI